MFRPSSIEEQYWDDSLNQKLVGMARIAGVNTTDSVFLGIKKRVGTPVLVVQAMWSNSVVGEYLKKYECDEILIYGLNYNRKSPDIDLYVSAEIIDQLNVIYLSRCNIRDLKIEANKELTGIHFTETTISGNLELDVVTKYCALSLANLLKFEDRITVQESLTINFIRFNQFQLDKIDELPNFNISKLKLHGAPSHTIPDVLRKCMSVTILHLRSIKESEVVVKNTYTRNTNTIQVSIPDSDSNDHKMANTIEIDLTSVVNLEELHLEYHYRYRDKIYQVILPRSVTYVNILDPYNTFHIHHSKPSELEIEKQDNIKVEMYKIE